MTAFHRVHGRDITPPVDKAVDTVDNFGGLSTGSYIYIWNGDINGDREYLQCATNQLIN